MSWSRWGRACCARPGSMSWATSRVTLGPGREETPPPRRRRRRDDACSVQGRSQTAAQEHSADIAGDEHGDPDAADRIAEIMLSRADPGEGDERHEQGISCRVARPQEIEGEGQAGRIGDMAGGEGPMVGAPGEPGPGEAAIECPELGPGPPDQDLDDVGGEA